MPAPARRPAGDLAHPHTLAIDCGGTGIKAAVLDACAGMVSERVRVLTPYPCPPETLVASLGKLTAELPPYDRVSVGMPGVVRRGTVLATPHYVTQAGPFTARLPELEGAWAHYDIAAALEAALGRPTRVVNDAEMQGCAVIEGRGFEIVLTLGTGLGFAMFDEGRLLPKVELSTHPFRKGETYDEQLGNHTRRRVGNATWTRRVHRAVDGLRPVLCWDRLYLGGGNTKHLRRDPPPDVTVIPNSAGIAGGVRLWDHPL